MQKLIDRYRNERTLKNAQAIRKYERSHPVATCLLDIADADLVADAIHQANQG